MKLALIDPKKIKGSQCPVFVLSDDPKGFYAWAIKAWTRGNYNHSMVMIRGGYFASQGARYKEVPADLYKGCNLKFWIIPGINFEQANEIIGMVKKRLRQPWWRRGYDYLGIVGQMTGIKWIHFPFRNFCSEGTATLIRVVFVDTPVRPDPDQLDNFLEGKAEEGRARVLGYSIAQGGGEG